VKIFMPANREKPVIVPYIKHVPPDVTAGIFWLKNRDPQHWHDVQNVEHVAGLMNASSSSTRTSVSLAPARSRAPGLRASPRTRQQAA
jgi:hypothetical protein